MIKKLYIIRYFLMFFILVMPYKSYSQLTEQAKIKRIQLISEVYGMLKFFYPGYAFHDGEKEKALMYLLQLALTEKEASSFNTKFIDYIRHIAPNTCILKSNALQYKLGTYSKNKKGVLIDTLIYWQHFGYGEVTGNMFRSIRVNVNEVDTSDFNAKYFKFSKKHLFQNFPNVNDYNTIIINNAGVLFIPLCLTKKEFNQDEVNATLKSYDVIDSNNQNYQRMAGLIKVHNVITYFYPYYNLLKEKPKLSYNLIKQTLACNDQNEYKRIIALYLNTTNDGHNEITDKNETIYYCPIKLHDYKNKIYVFKVFDTLLKKYEGAELLSINGVRTEKYLKVMDKYISGSTAQQNREQILRALTKGKQGDSIKLTFKYGLINETVCLKYNFNIEKYKYHYVNTSMPDYMQFEDSFLYLNPKYITEKRVDSLLKAVNHYKKVVLDLRGYPYEWSSDFILGLLKVNDTVSNWMKAPQILYPNQKKNTYFDIGWSVPKSNKSINDQTRFAFLMNEECLSFTESCLSIIKYYKLGLLIGKTSGGMNGDVNYIILPNGTKVRFTGLLTSQLDGKQLFGNGIKPDITVERINFYTEKNIQDIFKLF